MASHSWRKAIAGQIFSWLIALTYKFCLNKLKLQLSVQQN